ncbi:hypothetical protein CBL_09261 [Carabus blaptoides fortunei]
MRWHCGRPEKRVTRTRRRCGRLRTPPELALLHNSSLFGRKLEPAGSNLHRTTVIPQWSFASDVLNIKVNMVANLPGVLKYVALTNVHVTLERKEFTKYHKRECRLSILPLHYTLIHPAPGPAPYQKHYTKQIKF